MDALADMGAAGQAVDEPSEVDMQTTGGGAVAVAACGMASTPGKKTSSAGSGSRGVKRPSACSLFDNGHAPPDKFLPQPRQLQIGQPAVVTTRASAGDAGFGLLSSLAPVRTAPPGSVQLRLDNDNTTDLGEQQADEQGSARKRLAATGG